MSASRKEQVVSRQVAVARPAGGRRCASACRRLEGDRVGGRQKVSYAAGRMYSGSIAGCRWWAMHQRMLSAGGGRAKVWAYRAGYATSGGAGGARCASSRRRPDGKRAGGRNGGVMQQAVEQVVLECGRHAIRQRLLLAWWEKTRREAVGLCCNASLLRTCCPAVAILCPNEGAPPMQTVAMHKAQQLLGARSPCAPPDG